MTIQKLCYSQINPRRHYYTKSSFSTDKVPYNISAKSTSLLPYTFVVVALGIHQRRTHFVGFNYTTKIVKYDGKGRAQRPLMKTHWKDDKILPINDAQSCDIATQMALETGM